MTASPPLTEYPPPSGRYAFVGPRLGMRPWREGDLPSFHRIFGDERVIWWGRHSTDLDASRERLDLVLREQDTPRAGLGRFAAVELESGASVGNTVLRTAGFADGIEVGYHFAHAMWGRGYATEAARATLAHGFEAVDLDRIIATVALRNPASLRVMEKLGMARTHEADYLGLPHRMFEMQREVWLSAAGKRA